MAFQKVLLNGEAIPAGEQKRLLPSLDVGRSAVAGILRNPLAATMFATLLLLASAARAATIHVPDDWDTIERAIEKASSGDMILIASGTYLEHDIALKSEVTVSSETGVASSVVVSASSEGRVFTASGVTAVVLQAMTISNGRSPEGGGLLCEDSDIELREIVFRDNLARPGDGGGLCSIGSHVSLSNCVFESNEVGYYGATQTTLYYYGDGGGVACLDGSSLEANGVHFIDNYAWAHGAGLHVSGYDTDAVLVDCVFEGNIAPKYELDPSGSGGHGGGASIEDGATVTIADSEFTQNTAYWGGGGIYASHGADVTLEGVTVTECETEYSGGGLLAWVSASLNARDVHFAGNEARVGGAVGLCSPGGVLELSECTFLSNRAEEAGGAVLAAYAANIAVTARISDCTFAGNAAPEGSDVYFGFQTGSLLANCILAFGEQGGAVICDPTTPAEIVHCYAFGNAVGDSLCGNYPGNEFANPLFCDWSLGDLTLCADSPCLPATNPWEESVGAHGKGCGPCNSVISQTSWGVIKAMYR